MVVLLKQIKSFFSMGAMENLMLYTFEVLYTVIEQNR